MTAIDETGKSVVYTIVSRDGASVFAVDANGECGDELKAHTRDCLMSTCMTHSHFVFNCG